MNCEWWRAISRNGRVGYANYVLKKAICSVCNEGAQNAMLIRPDLKQLLIQIRRATSADQLEVLQWLVTKFPKQSVKATAKK